MISGSVRVACDSLLTTGMLQVVNRLVASWLSKLVIHRLAASCFNKLLQVCKWQVATSLILTSLLQLDESDKPVATWQQVATIWYNWQLVTNQRCFCLCNTTNIIFMVQVFFCHSPACNVNRHLLFVVFDVRHEWRDRSIFEVKLDTRAKCKKARKHKTIFHNGYCVLVYFLRWKQLFIS